MKRSGVIFLQGVVGLIGLGALAFLLWEPWVEGVNADATTIFQIYFDDPFLMLVYAGAIPFFMALFQAFKLLGYVRENQVFSEEAVQALRTIRYCALAIIGFVVVEEMFIILNHGDDDAAGAISLGIMITFVSLIIATAALISERILQNAVDIKLENDLTV